MRLFRAALDDANFCEGALPDVMAWVAANSVRGPITIIPMVGSAPDPDLQRLVDICFSLAIMVHCDERFTKRDMDGVAAYVADQLRQCGFPTCPMGSSWGILTDR